MRWVTLAVIAASLAGSAAFAQSMNHAAQMQGNMPMHDQMQGNMTMHDQMRSKMPMHDQMQGNMPMHMPGMQGAVGSLQTQPGQDAFGAVQEIVALLEADPATDWSKVNLDALRVHLIDMNEVALHADAPPSESTTASELQSPALGAPLRRSSACCQSTRVR